MPSARRRPPLSSLVQAQLSLALAHPPDHEDGRAPEHPGDGPRPRRGDFVRRRLGEPRGARGVPAGLLRRSSATRRSSTRAAATPPRSATWSAASRSRGSRPHLFGVPRLGPEHIAIGMGSTQLTHDLFRTLVDPGDTVLLLDPTYANYEGQLAFAAPGVAHRPAAGDRPGDAGRICRRPIPRAWPATSRGCSTGTGRGWCSSARPTTRPARSCRRRWPSVMLERTRDAGAWLAIDFAYKCQYLPAATRPTTRWSPADHPTRRRHPLELEVGARAGPAAGLDRGGAGGHRRARARAAVQHPLPRHARADDDGPVPGARHRRRLAAAVRGRRQRALPRSRAGDASPPWTTTSSGRGSCPPAGSTPWWTSAATPRRSCPRRSRPPACWSSPAADSARRSPTASASRSARWSTTRRRSPRASSVSPAS